VPRFGKSTHMGDQDLKLLKGRYLKILQKWENHYLSKLPVNQISRVNVLLNL